MDNTATTRARLAVVEGELGDLQGEHDRAMSAFQFDEANALQRRIEALEDERRAIIAALPLVKPTTEPPLGVEPVLARPRRLRRIRR
jgi:hypothetical protein